MRRSIVLSAILLLSLPAAAADGPPGYTAGRVLFGTGWGVFGAGLVLGLGSWSTTGKTDGTAFWTGVGLAALGPALMEAGAYTSALSVRNQGADVPLAPANWGIGAHAFCVVSPALNTVTLGSSVPSIGDCAFAAALPTWQMVVTRKNLGDVDPEFEEPPDGLPDDLPDDPTGAREPTPHPPVAVRGPPARGVVLAPFAPERGAGLALVGWF